MNPKVAQLKVDLSGEVRERLARDAEQQETSINNVGVGILANHFHVAFSASGSRGSGARTVEAGQVVFIVPIPLWNRINAAVRPGGRTKRAIVESVFRAHYQLDAAPVTA